MDELTRAERGVLDAIRRRPFSSQKELAAELDIARPTVASYVDRLQRKGYLLGRAYVVASDTDVCCIGGVTMDRTLRLKAAAVTGTSNPAEISLHRGGVARNVAENLARLSLRARLVSAVGDDEPGRTVIAETRAAGVDTESVRILAGANTGSYSAILDPGGELYIGIADLDICELLDTDIIDRYWAQLASARAVFADTNLATGTLHYLFERCRTAGLTLAVNSVSVPKAGRLPDDLGAIDFLFCNLGEARAILDAPSANSRTAARRLVARGTRHAVVTNGARGAWLAAEHGVTRVDAEAARVVDVSGAGDALVAATLCGLLRGYEPLPSLRMGMAAASMTIESKERSAPGLSAPRLGASARPANRCT